MQRLKKEAPTSRYDPPRITRSRPSSTSGSSCRNLINYCTTTHVIILQHRLLFHSVHLINILTVDHKTHEGSSSFPESNPIRLDYKQWHFLICSVSWVIPIDSKKKLGSIVILTIFKASYCTIVMTCTSW